MLAVVALLAFVLPLLPLQEWRAQFEVVVRSFGPWGPVVLGLIYVVLTLLLVPGSILTIAAGAMYGVALATVIVSVASTTSLATAFLLARYAMRERVQGWIARSPALTSVDRAIGREGWKIVALLRLSPLVSFGLQNYVYGVTSMPFVRCVVASWLSMLPGTLVYAYIGSFGADALADPEAAAGVWALRIVGLVATIGGTVYISRLAHRAVRAHVAVEGESSGYREIDSGRRGES